jgi:hypothetical protein
MPRQSERGSTVGAAPWVPDAAVEDPRQRAAHGRPLSHLVHPRRLCNQAGPRRMCAGSGVSDAVLGYPNVGHPRSWPR